ncbi:hypothetical protein BJX68DRAFT_248261 [Aspergillus pseudodeflectus]|uniref:Secreted protein n=1 Tax=Aspergillus pseudodeflectus TaxID=176178 RepID=A0ABR4JGL6_9EURO
MYSPLICVLSVVLQCRLIVGRWPSITSSSPSRDFKIFSSWTTCLHYSKGIEKLCLEKGFRLVYLPPGFTRP